MDIVSKSIYKRITIISVVDAPPSYFRIYTTVLRRSDELQRKFEPHCGNAMVDC